MTLSNPKLLGNIRVVLARTSHPGNIGAAMRAMKTMGLSQLVSGQPGVFPNSQADAMAAGATDLLAQARVCATLEEALADTTLVLGVSARRRDIVTEVLTPPEAASRLLDRGAGRAGGAGVRQRNQRHVERGAEPVSGPGDDCRQSGIQLAQPGGGGAGAELRNPSGLAGAPGLAGAGAGCGNGGRGGAVLRAP